MFEPKIQEFVELLNNAGINGGCADLFYVDDVQRSLGVQFPAAYTAFLRCAGHDFPAFGEHWHRIGDLELLQSGVPRRLRASFGVPDNAFIFYSQQGVNIRYFVLDEIDDPPVYEFNKSSTDQRPHPLAKSLTAFLIDQIQKERRRIAQRPLGECPKCGEQFIRMLWNYNNLSELDREDIATGCLVAGTRVTWNYSPHPRNRDSRIMRKGVPAKVCLRCEPRWLEVQKLSIQEYDAQLAKTDAVNTQDFEKAAQLKDSQDKLRQRLDTLINGPGDSIGPNRQESTL